jgi:alpha-galactosidase
MLTIQKSLRLAFLIFFCGILLLALCGSETSAAEENATIEANRRWAETAFDNIESLPFSFVYDGKTSAELMKQWQKDIKDETIDGGQLLRTLVLTDPHTKLEVRAVATIYTDTPGVDWTLTFTNRGDADSPVLEKVNAVDSRIALPKPEADAVVHRLNGVTNAVDDWGPFDEQIPPGKRIEFAAIGGRASIISPFFNLDWGAGGVITAIGWSGQWAATVDRVKPDSIRVQAGMQFLRVKLRPGESIRSPRILQLRWSGVDPSDSYNLFRQTMFAHILPRIDGRIVVPPIAQMSTSFYELNETNEQNVLSHLASTRGLGFETFWLDAYWTGAKGFPESMGDYGFPIERVEPKDRFPNGMRSIGDAVEKEGLAFLLWFEPERVAAGTYLAKEHPEWVMSPAGDGSGLFDLGNPEARKFMTDYLNTAAKAYKITCMRFDYNIDPLGYWQFIDSKNPDRIGIAEIRYIEGLYRMWDDIRKANPKLYIDNCASGGRRIDLETMSRSIPLWRSDNTCDMLDHKAETVQLAAIKNQVMSAGLNRYVPLSTVGQMGATPYLFRSGFNGGIAFAEDIRPADYPRDLLKQGIAEGKRIRKYYFGNFYPLTTVTTSPKDWCVMQYHRQREQDGMIVAFRRPESSDADLQLELREIDKSADYEVTRSTTYGPSAPTRIQGSELSAMKLHIEDRPGSVIVEYRKVPASAPLK